MDLFSAIYAVKNLDGYVEVTEEYANRSQTNLKVLLNTATVLALKKVRSFEIEYFNKRDENGIACTVLQNLLCVPPSKVWGLLAKELIHLLQYWLEAIRKHLINHTTHWWMFLSLLLKFIKDIYLKDSTIPDLLVEFTAECLFDLATGTKPDVHQRHEILHCLNMVCAASSREVRFAFRTKFADCFVKLASGMSTSGFLPYQYSALECLLRWLLPRQERCLRALALDKWFPRDLCPDAARALFLNSTWMNFLQDAREFLNALNEGNGLLTSVICRQLTIGQIVVINGTERQITWMDFNSSVKCVSVLLDPRELEVFGVVAHRACEALLIDDDITETAVLSRESLGLTISLDLLRPPSIRPNNANVNGQQVTALVSSRTDLRALDRAMRTTFGDKYQLLLDLDIEVSQSPQVSSSKNKAGNCSEDDSRFSHPVEAKRHKRAGYIVRPKYGEALASPSTASTSSIIHLKEKLAALPRFPRFEKEPVSVVAEPSLSKVTECLEFQNCGVKSAFQRNAFPKLPPEAKSRSDGDTPRPRNRGGRRNVSPVVSDDNSMLPAGPDYRVINETVESLPKDYMGENIVDALSREALLAIPPKHDSGINTDEKKSQEESEAIDDTPNEIREARNREPYKLKLHCNISTTDDESNTEAINETPAILCRKKSAVPNRKPPSNIEEKQTFDVKTVEEFFSKHVAESHTGEIVISPRLAKKINETSSETSDFLDDDDLLNEDIHTDIEERIFDDATIIDCLNEMIDSVCTNMDNLIQANIADIMTTIVHPTIVSPFDNVDISNVENISKPKQTPKAKSMKYKPAKKAKPRATKKRKAVLQQNTKKMSTIIEQKDEEITRKSENDVEVAKIASPQKAETPKCNNKETPAIRKKRKLYSPKDDAVEEEVVQYNEEKSSDDVPLTKIKDKDSSKAQSNAMCYKEIEKERKKYTRLPRTRTSKGKIAEPPSPRTAKMNTTFDNLKVTTESNETIRLASKGDSIYNFSSDSEDEDFKKKKIDIKKRISVEPKAKGKNTRRGKESDTSYEDTNKTKPVKRKTVAKRTTKQKALDKDTVVDLVKVSLVDEKMREAVDEKLNTSIVVEHPTILEPVELEPILQQTPQMELIQESESNDTVITKKRTKKTERNNNTESNDTTKNKIIAETQPEMHDSASNDTMISKKNDNKRTKKNKAVAVKKEKAAKKVKTLVVPDDDDGTSSPLPGLLVEESKPKSRDDNNDSLNTNMLQKFKNVFRDGPEANESVLTQNMLSDAEKFNSSVQNNNSILDEISYADYDKEVAKTSKKQNKKALPTKPNKKGVKKEIKTTTDEIIVIRDNISECDRQSEKSIATDGITAHGDEDELPPHTESLLEIFEPRELPDLSPAKRDYFTMLTREVHDYSENSVESNKSANKTSVGNTGSRSPVVLVKRLSLDDISEWMPSRRTSDSDSTLASSKIISATKRSETPTAESSVESTPSVKTAKLSKRVETRRYTSKPVQIASPKSPTADLVKPKTIGSLFIEEYNKWFPQMPISAEEHSPPKKPRKELKLICPKRFKSKIDDKKKRNVTLKTKSIAKTAEVHKPVETIIQTDTIETNVSRINTRSKSREATRKRKLIDSDTEQARPKEPKNKEQIKIDIKPAPKTTARKSIISPIKLLGDFTPILDAGNSSADENDTNIRTTNVLSKSKESQLHKSKSNVSKADTNSSRELSKPETPEIRKRDKCKSPILSVPKEKSVKPKTSFEAIKSSEKPKKIIKEPRRLFDDTIKKMQALKDDILTKSGPSSSSVIDWLEKTDPVVKETTLPLKETIENLEERLNTTLCEFDHIASKKSVNLLVEALADLDEVSEHHRKALDKIEKFKEKFQSQALKLTREDCERRRAIVLLLRADVQAVLNRMNEK